MREIQQVREVLDPRFLRAQLERVRQEGPHSLPEEDYAAALEELEQAEQRIPPLDRAVSAPDLQREPQPRPDAAFFPRTPLLNIIQSTLETCILSRGDEVVTQVETPAAETGRRPAARLAPDTDLFRPFGPCDISWISTKVAEGLQLFSGRPDFPDHPAPTGDLAPDGRVVLVSDWATGVGSARLVAEQMGRRLAEATGRDRHVVHLGDTYYSGWREEYVKRFLPYWPHAVESEHPLLGAERQSRHYSGGHGYFGFLLRDPRFAHQHGSSFFKLESPYWQILGLDTAYEDQDLAGSQVDWVRDQVARTTKKTMLLSHHQFLSAYAEAGDRLRERLDPVLREKRIDAWFWGHEHRCAVYEESESIRYPRCIGHGGVPVLVPPEDAPKPAGVVYEYRGAEVSDPYRWGLFGFAVLDFRNDATVEVSYVNEKGDEHYNERLK